MRRGECSDGPFAVILHCKLHRLRFANPSPLTPPSSLRLAHHRSSLRGAQKIDKGLGSLRLLAIGGDGRGKHQVTLQVAGKGPTSSTPGAINTLASHTPNSASPLATAGPIATGAGTGLVLAFISSAMPRRSNTFRICASKRRLMSGLGAPALTATPKPTRAMSMVGPATNRRERVRASGFSRSSHAHAGDVSTV